MFSNGEEILGGKEEHYISKCAKCFLLCPLVPITALRKSLNEPRQQNASITEQYEGEKEKRGGQEALHAAYGMTDKTSLTPSNSSHSPFTSMALQGLTIPTQALMRLLPSQGLWPRLPTNNPVLPVLGPEASPLSF